MSKRTKKRCKHSNPLFHKWLIEWMDEANSRGSNMKFNFQRAVKSLQRYPLPLYSGKDCLVLAHFGEKICNLIDKRLEEYVIKNGPVNWADHIEIIDINTKNRSKKRQAERGEKAYLPQNVSSNIYNTVKEQHSKPYIPSYRSGAFALLIALHNESIKQGYPGFLKKDKLINIAQEFCDASFIIPPSGSYYTAWSSMSTLITKNLVHREGNPSKYSLTQTGRDLAELLQRHQNSLDSMQGLDGAVNQQCKEIMNRKVSFSVKKNITRGKVNRVKHSVSTEKVHNISSSDDDTDHCGQNSEEIASNSESARNCCREEVSVVSDESDDNISSAILSEQLSASPLHGKEITYRQETSLCNTEGFFSAFPSKNLGIIDTSIYSQPTSNDMKDKGNSVDRNISLATSSKTLMQNLQPGLKFAFVDSLGRETSVKDQAFVKISDAGSTLQFLIKCRLEDLLKSSFQYEVDEKRSAHPGYVYAYLSDSSAPEFSPGLSNAVSPGLSYSGNAYSAYESEVNSLHLSLSKKSDMTTMSSSSEMRKAKEAFNKGASGFYEPVGSSVQSFAEHLEKNEVEMDKEVHSKPVFSLYPGQFKIKLCVDNTEVMGGFTSGKKGTKDIIISELKRNGVDFEVRNLNIGDFLWISHEKFHSGNKVREVVLPYVIERKRMDDLASSIRDGRFKEQKFRLKRSGLHHLIYLVEEIGSNYVTMPLSACEQATTNTQIIDGFTVKVTTDQRESAAYLTVMTRYLQEKYKGSVIDCVDRRDMESQQTNSSLRVSGLSFEELNSFSVKNQVLSVQDMFAKHLLQLFGLSVDKVAAIIEKYPTPAHLQDALARAPVSQREDFLSLLKCSRSGRTVGSPISIQLSRLYSWQDIL